MPVLHIVTFFLALISTQAFALPIDWNGAFGVDTNLINSYRRIEQKTDRSAVGGGGSQELPLATGEHQDSKFQTYVFRLQPVVLVNDAASVKAELTTGYGRGGRLGDSAIETNESSQTTPTNSYGNILYPYTLSGNNALNVKQLYMELYSDTATYMIGRHTFQFGLGALVNSGSGLWDRHFSMRDGFTINLKLGNFHIAPYYSKSSSVGSLTGATDITEEGFTLVYDNPDREMAFGLLYGGKNSSANESLTKTTISGSSASLGAANVKMVDLYFQKSFGPLSFATEVPILSGDIGNIYGTDTKYKAKAILVESWYKINSSWRFGFDGGRVSGEDSSQSSFEAMYLHPNYQIANLLFKYNLRSVASPSTVSPFDSFVHNVNYYKFKTQYASEKWTWDLAVVLAQAAETAKAGSPAFNHTTNRSFTATQTQSDKLGTEVDVNFNYQWNNEVSIGGDVGYLFTGDYFAYTNDAATTNTAKNSYLLQLKAGIKF